MHRRNELEERLNVFNSKCEAAIRNIKILKTKAQGLPLQLNCEPKDLKERFLTCMQELEKYLYLITDVVLATETLDEPHLTRDCTPVLDSVSGLTQPLSPTPFNIIDTLSEAGPSKSISCNHCPPEKPKRQKIPKEQQVLIQFSSTSCSQESVNEKKEDETIKKVKEIQPDIVEDLNNIKLENADTPGPYVLPAQDLLEVDHTYTAMITHVEGLNFWAITAKIDEVHSLMTEMTDYYKANRKTMTLEEMQLKPYCAFLDDNSYYRALFVKFYEDDKTVEVYLVDTGELRIGSIDNVQPLLTVYTTPAPYARHCHLAGVDAGAYSEDMLRLQEEFIKKYIMGTICTIQVDDNTSESLGVYVILPNNEILNDIMAKEGLILPLDKSALPTTRQMPPEEYAVDDDDLDITDCPEYEDPVEAVTGYHNRDEADICKHYKGEPEKTCFKGKHCNKKHIMKHPDGWTLDRVPVVGKCKTVPLPPPDTWVKVLVTHVPHFNRVFVQLNTQNEKEEVPAFGTVLPPRTLAGLNRDMNSPATRASYQPLTVAPAPGELVAALFPLDKNYYRARVRSISRADQSVELMYVDYGTIMYVKENEIKVLNPRFTVLPMQAIPCVLGGVTPKSHLSQHWAQAKMQLEVLTQDKIFDAHVLAREYDEIVVALFDKNGYNIAEKLAEQGFVNYEEYEVVHDTDVRQRIVVP